METPNRATWNDVATPILQWIADHPGARAIEPAKLTDEFGVDEDAIAMELDRLLDAGFITGQPVMGNVLMLPSLLERGLRAVGVWPPEDAYEGFVHELDRAIAAASSEEAKGRLVRVRDSLAGLTRDVGVNLFSGYLQGRFGI